MAAPIGPIAGAGVAPVTRSAPAAEPRGEGPDFADSLASAITDASGAEREADRMAADFAAGKPGIGIHETIIAAEKANVQVRFAVSLKNKILDAYRELMNTQV